MISTPREKSGFQAKQEGETNESNSKLIISKLPPSSSSSRQWSGFSRNPRIVRVSRTFGGKDRHSKVCTIRGLRDRRIRLSVPTAIQLYDLQDRLGLSQPSKVIDWLLDVTKNDIDKLPPLQIPQGLFDHQQQQQQMMLQSNTTTSSLSPFFDGTGGIKINSTNDDVDDHVDHQHQSNKYWDLEASSSSMTRAKGKEVENAIALLNPYYNYHWDPSNLSLSQFGSSGQEFVSQQQAAAADQYSLLYGNNAFPSGSHHHHHHLFFCPPPAAATMPSLFPTYVSNAQEGTHDHSSRQSINHFQLLSSNSSSSPQHNNFMPFNSLATSSQVKPFSLNLNPGHSESYPDKEDT